MWITNGQQSQNITNDTNGKSRRNKITDALGVQRDPLESKGGSHNKAAKMIKKKKNRARTMGEGVLVRQSGLRAAKKKTKWKLKAELKPLTKTFAHGKLPFIDNH